MEYSWLIIAIFFLLLELGHPGLFFFLSFSFGAGAAALASLYWQSYTLQGSIFLGVTILAGLILRLWFKKQDSAAPKTNVYALQGKQAQVVREIGKNKVGAVKVQGDIWLAKTSDDETLHENDLVEIVRVQGAHVIVTKVKK